MSGGHSVVSHAGLLASNKLNMILGSWHCSRKVIHSFTPYFAVLLLL